jgi:hypothetical protein
MDRPAQEHEPQDPGEDELDYRDDQSALQELPEPRDEEARQRGDDVSR